MQSTLRAVASALALTATGPLASAAQCDQVWSTGWTNYTLGMSHLTATEDREVADDFDFTGAVGRIFVNGTGPLTGSYPVDGVWVRFYAWTASGPGALQHARYLAAGDPALGVLAIPQTIDVELVPPFAAGGKHFVALQVDFAPTGGYWQPWTGSNATPMLTHAWVRDNLAGGAWSQYSDVLGPVNRDMSFELYSAPTGSSCPEWSEAPTPIPSIEYTILRDLRVLAPDDVWAVGHYQQGSVGNSEMFTLAMHHDGNAWSTTPTPSPAPAPGMSNDYLWAVDGVASDDVWAAGEQNMQVPGGWVGPQPFAIHWDGSSWTEVPTPIPPTSIGAGYAGSSVLEIEAVDSDDVWFLGRWVGPYPGTSSTRPAMAMHWDGSSISLVQTPVLAGSQSIHAADAYSSNEIWAVGSMSSATTSYPYVLRWNGSQWSHVPVPPAGITPGVFDVAVVAPNDVWISATRVVGTTTGNYLLHYNGASWTQMAAPIVGDMLALSSSDIWLAGADLHHWNGAAWSVADDFGCIPSPAFAVIDGIAGGGPSSLWAAGRQLGAGLIPLTVRFDGSCNSSTYCTSSTTTNGCRPAISGSGLPSASAASGFTIAASQVEGAVQGILFYGTSGQQAVPWMNGSTSYLCLRLPMQRMNVHSSGGIAGACNGVLAQDWNAYMAANPGALGNPRFAGQTFDAQAWFRDPPAPKTTNLSNALHFVLAP